ncbi:MAG: iron-containing alcohol dehydrogenase [candidate division Zixibacteria bacterium]|nr:iron-containing alcohol dehydrogenase [candidate division Zixibacteria bacterium]
MQAFNFYLPTKIIFGSGKLEQVGIEAISLGKRALIVTGKRSASAFGIIDRVTTYLEREGVEVVVFDKIEPNPRTTTVDDAGELARKNKCDMVIGLGGGSPMDAAKAIAVAAVEGKPIWDYISHGQEIVKPIKKALPIIAIPTLAATGSEADAGGVITNWETHEKAVIGSPILFPKVSIIDPELTTTVPEGYTIDGGVDIITHVIEGLFTGADNTPLQDRFSFSVIKTVMDNLPKVIDNQNDVEARANLSWASAVALSGMINSGRGGAYPIHALEHSLSGHYDISHGRGLALLLPAIMEYSYKSRPAKYAFLAEELFDIHRDGQTDEELAVKAISKMKDFLKSVNRLLTMKDVGIGDDSKFETMADDALRIYGVANEYLDNPRKLYKKDILALFSMIAD